jgi:hypothetical protein
MSPNVVAVALLGSSDGLARRRYFRFLPRSGDAFIYGHGTAPHGGTVWLRPLATLTRQADERLVHVRHIVKQYGLRRIHQHRHAQEADGPVAPSLQVDAARRIESVEVPLVLFSAEERKFADLEVCVELRAIPPTPTAAALPSRRCANSQGAV